jgi:hypothetical protein
MLDQDPDSDPDTDPDTYCIDEYVSLALGGRAYKWKFL